jgi:hypothetical protein
VSEQGPADEGLEDAAEDVAAEDFSVPMWVWTVLAFVLLMAVVIVVIIRGGAKREEPANGMGSEAPVTQPATQAGEQPVTQPA